MKQLDQNAAHAHKRVTVPTYADAVYLMPWQQVVLKRLGKWR